MSPATIEIVPVLQDNYVYLVHDDASGATACIDPAVAGPVMAALDRRGWRLTHIFNTHHHADHVGGNHDLKAATGARVVGAAGDAARIPGMDIAVGQGDVLALGDLSVCVLQTPGHTSGHVAFWLDQAHALFAGDTLFSLGCGRLFEGTAAQMWDSLCRLRALPGHTRLYAAHEYTAANGRFALSVDKANGALAHRLAQVQDLRAQGLPTFPVTLETERACNPFLRADHADLARALGLDSATPAAQVFADLRRRKDVF